MAIGLFVSIPAFGLIDYLLGPGLSFSVFFLISLSIGSWYLGKNTGLGLALESAVIIFFEDLFMADESLSHLFASLINTTFHLVFFIFSITLLLELKQRLADEEQLADTDFLTGLANSRRFYELVHAEMLRSLRYDRPFTVMYIDLDNFKIINDTHGHDFGDEVLKLAADTIKQVTRQTDTIARLGGDEFAGLFPETGYDAAEMVLHRIKTLVLDEMKARRLPVTLSIGAVTYETTPQESPKHIIKEVDNLVLKVKRAGKNDIIHIRG